jgi:Uma2 family endonuclease
MSIATDATTEQLIAELYKVPGKAEIVGGRIVMMSPTGDMPFSGGFAIAVSLRSYAQRFGGRAYPDNIAYLVDLPNRKSFSPDASYYTGPRTKMKFLSEAPVFAVEVRSEGDYGRAAEREMAEKRVEYFAADTKVVWGVDMLEDDVIRKYSADSPDTPTIYRKGQLAEAEPGVPGWTFPVDEMFA